MRSRTIPTIVLGLAALWSTQARASEVFPGALQEAAGMDCVPVCLMCHTTNPGTATTWQKPLALALYAKGMRRGDTNSLKAAYKAYAADPLNATAITDIKAGREPGEHVDVCGPTYGCGAHVAKEAALPRDFTGPLWVAGAMLTAGILRRRRKPHAG